MRSRRHSRSRRPSQTCSTKCNSSDLAHGEPAVLELEDIQHFLISRPPALSARYEFLTFRQATAGRKWLSGILDKVGIAKQVGSNESDSRWVTVAFTWN